MKKLLITIISFLIVCSLFSCGGGGEVDREGSVTLIENGVANFRIVLAEDLSDDVRREVSVALRMKLKKDHGITFEIIEESEEDDGEAVEVLVGNVKSRGDEYSYDGHMLGEEGYVIKLISDKIVINAGSASRLRDAITEFGESILGVGADEIYNVTMLESDSIEVFQNDYEINGIFFDGEDARGYKIAAELTRKYYSECAELLRDHFYKNTGYWFEIVDLENAPRRSIVIKHTDLHTGHDSYRVGREGESLVIECAFDNKLVSETSRLILQDPFYSGGKYELSTAEYSSDVSVVYYEEFGAVGDGKTDDFLAIYNTHEFANECGQTVKADPDATYYICDTAIYGSSVACAVIKTNVDWQGARFTVDDRHIDPAGATKKYGSRPIFKVEPDCEMITLTDDATLEGLLAAGINRNTERIEIDVGHSGPLMIVPKNYSHKVYRRRGYSAYAGGEMHEVIVLSADGTVSPDTPIIFDYTDLYSVDVYKLDPDSAISIKNGVFTTRASRVNTIYTKENGKRDAYSGYLQRGITVYRPYTTVENVEHYITDELTIAESIGQDGEIIAVGATYRGFFCAYNTNEVTFKNCVLTGHRCYPKPNGGTGGTYDFSGALSNKIDLEDCVQSSFFVTVQNGVIRAAAEGDRGAVPSMAAADVIAVRDSGSRGGFRMHWGIGGSNYCKNMEYIGSTLSRYDAHSGLCNGKIIDSTVTCISLTGNGLLEVKNSRFFAEGTGYGNNAIFRLRSDYGYTWEGDIIAEGVKAYVYPEDDIHVVSSGYSNWYFGYTSHMPNISLTDTEFYDIHTKELLPTGTRIHFTASPVSRASTVHLPITNKKAIVSVEDKDSDGFIDEPHFDSNRDGVIDEDDIIDLDGNGVKGNTSLSYAEILEEYDDIDGGIPIDVYTNLNIYVPPEYFKVSDNKGLGYVYVICDTGGSGISDGAHHDSVETYGGFFGDTKFIYGESGEYFLGSHHTDQTKTDIFSFE